MWKTAGRGGGRTKVRPQRLLGGGIPKQPRRESSPVPREEVTTKELPAQSQGGGQRLRTPPRRQRHGGREMIRRKQESLLPAPSSAAATSRPRVLSPGSSKRKPFRLLQEEPSEVDTATRNRGAVPRRESSSSDEKSEERRRCASSCGRSSSSRRSRSSRTRTPRQGRGALRSRNPTRLPTLPKLLHASCARPRGAEAAERRRRAQ